MRDTLKKLSTITLILLHIAISILYIIGIAKYGFSYWSTTSHIVAIVCAISIPFELNLADFHTNAL